jgi:hypothetical protein
MSCLIHKQWRRYFQMPLADAVEMLSFNAYRVYGLLCRTMNAQSAVVIELSNAEISERTDIRPPKTIKGIRDDVSNAGLVEIRKAPLVVYAFVMLGERGVPIPAPEGRIGVRRHIPGNKAGPSGRRASASRPSSAVPVPSPQPS